LEKALQGEKSSVERRSSRREEIHGQELQRDVF
jgi:hypothetical protein